MVFKLLHKKIEKLPKVTIVKLKIIKLQWVDDLALLEASAEGKSTRMIRASESKDEVGIRRSPSKPQHMVIGKSKDEIKNIPRV